MSKMTSVIIFWFFVYEREFGFYAENEEILQFINPKFILLRSALKEKPQQKPFTFEHKPSVVGVEWGARVGFGVSSEVSIPISGESHREAGGGAHGDEAVELSHPGGVLGPKSIT